MVLDKDLKDFTRSTASARQVHGHLISWNPRVRADDEWFWVPGALEHVERRHAGKESISG